MNYSEVDLTFLNYPHPDPAGFPLGSHTIAKSKILFSTEDSYYKKTRIFQIDANSYPAVITNAFRIVDTNGVLANAFPSSQFPDFNLVNDDKTVNLDAEGIALSYRGGYWIANEGAGTVNESKITSNNFILYVTGDGTIQQVIKIPQALTDIQYRYGLEGIAEQGDKLYVCFQRAWGTEANPRIGIYDTITTAWEFVYYPLETPKSQYGGWVGLSDISPLGGNRFLVLERDNRGMSNLSLHFIRPFTCISDFNSSYKLIYRWSGCRYQIDLFDRSYKLRTESDYKKTTFP